MVVDRFAPKRDLRLDALKGFAISMVLLLHLGPVRWIAPGWRVAGDGVGPIGVPLAFAVGFVYRELLQLAVPLFYMVSLSFYMERTLTRESYFWKRLLRLGELVGFWLVVQYSLYVIVQRKMPPLDLLTLRRGGPSVAGTGAGTVIYFLIDLVALIVLSEAALIVAEWLGARGPQIVGWLMIVGPAIWYLAAPFFGVRIEYWGLVNFVPYAGVSILLPGDLYPVVKYRWALLAGWAAFVAVDMVNIVLRPGWNLDILPDYGRVSIIVGSLALLAFLLKYLPTPRWLVLLGSYSLGVFVVHTNILSAVSVYVSRHDVQTAWGPISFGFERAVIVLGLTFALVWVLAQTPLKRFVK